MLIYKQLINNSIFPDGQIKTILGSIIEGGENNIKTSLQDRIEKKY